MKNIPIGSLITSYYDGYFVVTKIDPVENGSILHFVQVAKKDGTPVKSSTMRNCSDFHCEIVDPDKLYKEELKQIKLKFKHLKKFAKSCNS